MLFFKNADPLEEIAGIIRDANPTLADRINKDNVIVDKIEVIKPEDNDGFNTQGMVRLIGDLNDVVGIVTIRWNRLNLRNMIPWNMLHVEAPSERGYIRLNNLENVFSKGLGTKMESSGRYKDYNYTSARAQAKGSTLEYRVRPLAESLRYTPDEFSFKIYCLGTALDFAVTDVSCLPFYQEDGRMKITHVGKSYWDPTPRKEGDTWKDAAVTLGSVDFTSVWGEDPRTVIIEHGEEGKRRYKFEAVAFAKMNLLLAAAGLPPIPDPYFDTYDYRFANNRGGGWRYFATIRPQELTHSLRIQRTNTDWDYETVSGLVYPYGAGYWANTTQYWYFNYAVK